MYIYNIFCVILFRKSLGNRLKLIIVIKLKLWLYLGEKKGKVISEVYLSGFWNGGNGSFYF